MVVVAVGRNSGVLRRWFGALDITRYVFDGKCVEGEKIYDQSSGGDDGDGVDGNDEGPFTVRVGFALVTKIFIDHSSLLETIIYYNVCTRTGLGMYNKHICIGVRSTTRVVHTK